MEPFSITHAKLLYCRFSVIYGDKFVKANHDDYFKSIWYEEWTSGMTGICVSAIKDALAYCKINLDWSPSIAEFRRICEQHAGVPSMGDALQAAIRRDFSHPVVSIAYEKVGSWAMKNDKEQDLRPKFQAAYTEALNQFRVNPDKTWQLLESSNQQQALPEPPPKIPSHVEIMSFRERLKYYTDLSNVAKSKMAPSDHPQCKKTSVMIGHKDFDSKLYNDRRQYLTNMDEILAASLSNDDKYDRIRFLREDIAHRKVESYRSSNPPPKEEKVAPRSYNSARRWDKWSD